MEKMLIATRTERARPVPVEQRKNQRLRERFDAAMEVLRPVLKHDGDQQGAMYFRALSKLHRHFPDMSQGELEALVVSVTRALNSR